MEKNIRLFHTSRSVSYVSAGLKCPIIFNTRVLRRPWNPCVIINRSSDRSGARIVESKISLQDHYDQTSRSIHRECRPCTTIAITIRAIFIRSPSSSCRRLLERTIVSRRSNYYHAREVSAASIARNILVLRLGNDRQEVHFGSLSVPWTFHIIDIIQSGIWLHDLLTRLVETNQVFLRGCRQRRGYSLSFFRIPDHVFSIDRSSFLFASRNRIPLAIAIARKPGRRTAESPGENDPAGYANFILPPAVNPHASFSSFISR